MITEFLPIASISTLWLAFWWYGISSGSKENRLIRHTVLETYTSILLFTIFIFYTLSYNRIGILEINYFDSTLWQTLNYCLLFLSGFLLLRSRFELRTLSFVDIMFRKNEHYTQTGLYKYIRHPMYWGIIGTLISSWFFYPTIGGLVCIVIATFLILIKIRLE